MQIKINREDLQKIVVSIEINKDLFIQLVLTNSRLVYSNVNRDYILIKDKISIVNYIILLLKKIL